jgi:dipeptidyl aminopeptidase/acylaminoacyl peptidase
MKKLYPLVVCLALLLSDALVAGANSSSAADDLETSVTLLAKVTGCWSPTFSPDGGRIAFISDLNGVPQIWTVDTHSGWPSLVTALNDPITGVGWSPDGQWLAFSLAPGGGMNGQIYLIRPDGTAMRLLTDGGKENNWLGRWSHDGKVLAFASNRAAPDAMDSYIYGLNNGEKRLAAKNPGIGLLTDISHDGKRGILYRMRNRSDSDLFLINLDESRETILTSHEGPGSFGDGRFSPDGSAVYVSSNKDRDLIALGRIKIGRTGPGPIEVIAARNDGELQEFTITEDGKTAALVWNVGGRSELAFLDLATLKQTSVRGQPTEIVGGVTFSKDGRMLAMISSGSASPADIWVYDLNSGRFSQVTQSPHAGVDLNQLVRPELVRFPAHDGLMLSGWLYRPKGVKAPGPIVLSFHGGPEWQEQPWFDKQYQALLSQGIAVFAPNVRGSSGFGKKFVNLDNGALRVNAVRDIKTCVDYAVKTGVADPKRIGIMGGSYGGYMVMAGLTEYPELFAAGADLFGVVNFQTFFEHTEPWMAAISTIEYGDPKTEAEMLQRLSPIHKIDRVLTPTIVLHGANDTNVPVVEAEQVVNSLKKRGVPVEFILFPDEGHGFQKIPNQIRSTVSITRWFAKYLKAS